MIESVGENQARPLTSDERLYLSPPHMSGLEPQYVQETCASDWIAPLGPGNVTPW